MSAAINTLTSMSQIEDIIFDWHNTLYREMVNCLITPAQFLAGLEQANHWGIARYAALFGEGEVTDLCITTSF